MSSGSFDLPDSIVSPYMMTLTYVPNIGIASILMMINLFCYLIISQYIQNPVIRYCQSQFLEDQQLAVVNVSPKLIHMIFYSGTWAQVILLTISFFTTKFTKL